MATTTLSLVLQEQGGGRGALSKIFWKVKDKLMSGRTHCKEGRKNNSGAAIEP